MPRVTVRIQVSFALVAILLGGGLGCSDDAATPTAPAYASRANLAIFLANGEPTTLADVLRDYDFELIASYGEGRCILVKGEVDPAELEADARIVAFQRDSAIAISSPVELTMSFYEGEFETDLPAQDAFVAWYLSLVHTYGRGAGVRVAVLDTGVDPTHPLLSAQVRLIAEGEWRLGSLERETGTDSDGDGVVDEAFGHGTHVAGIVASVAPESEILCIRVLDSDGVGTAFDLARGLYRAVDWGANVINLSLVLDGESDVIDEALRDLRNRGISIVGAAGNVPGRPFYPASESQVLSIAAVDHAFALAPFSAYDGVRLAAPGVEVLSAFPGDRWASATGTSMACASATGALAVLAGMLGSADEAEGLLRATASDLDPVNDGAIDLVAATVEAAARASSRR